MVDIPAACGADALANQLATSLVGSENFDITFPDFSGDDFQVPVIDPATIGLPFSRLTNADLTTGDINGTGTFDRLMAGFKGHLGKEFESNRISGAEYTKAYIALTQGAMSNAVQYLLGKDLAYWQSVNAQLQAQTAQVGLVTARVMLESEKTKLQVIRLEATNQKINYAIGKLKLSTESVNYCSVKYNFDNLLPLQKTLAQESIEAARAQTLDTRTDGTVIVGSLGKQKDLYSQQITSYKRDAEMKAVKVFTDAWTVMKTIDEGLAPPTLFANTNLDAILATMMTNNAL